jgi:conjugative relaxase-like TrwC/TraI family protein
MLRMNQNMSVDRARSYYSTADYYSEGQELTGQWRGQGSELLGLEGEVRKADWDALCDNRHPATGEQLTPRRRDDRTVGYDFNFHVPKSVSVLYAMTRDERILEAFREAVNGTMCDMESEMRTRVRKERTNMDRITGNLVWGEFVHFTSRPVGGVPDPHLHAHAFVFNTTFDAKEDRWKAGQFRELKRDAPYFEAVFHSRLSHRLAELGLPIARTAKGWELEGAPQSLVDKFSRRTAQIEEKARQMGIDNVEAKAELGAKTRERKQKDLTFPELQETWRSWLSPQECDVISALERKIGSDAEPADDTAAARALAYALEHSFARKSVVPERHVLATALRQGVGQTTVEQVARAAAESNLIIGERKGRRMATTRKVLDEERYVIGFAREGRGTCRPFVRHKHTFQREWLNDPQKQAVERILGSRDRVLIVRGAAGVGKTELMKEAAAAIEESGTRVFAFAPSVDASHGVLRDAGFQEAQTVAMLLVNQNLQNQVAGGLIWIDEAGLVGMETMSKVFSLADRLDCRVLLTGDRRQHSPVDRGAALRLLEDEAGLLPAEVKEIQRQKGKYKEAVKALSEGRAVEGYDRLDALGWVEVVPFAERYQRLAADYTQAVAHGKTALVVSPTHAEADRITCDIRQSLKQHGKIRPGERPVQVLENRHLTAAERGDTVNYCPGDVLQFHQNAKGFTRGDRLAVGDSRPLPVDQAARFQVFRPHTLPLAPGDIVRITHNGRTADNRHRLDNGTLYKLHRFDDEGNIVLDNGWLVGKNFGHLAHGYVVTSHASQGKTVDRVFIGQSSKSFPASSREQFYVSVSRGRERATIYTGDKEALRAAITQTDERISATELAKISRTRQAAASTLRDAGMPDERREHRQERELVHER